ncbi:hypothetical protein HYV43_00710 [Candidatus Micrarchaeota archaeon]|nr:hypothetical protein [Candidatus Micrarchaeota archaeon]
MDVVKLIRQNPATAFFLALAAVWLLVRHSVAPVICQGSAACWLYPDSWPQLLGVTSASSAWMVGLVAALLFALPFGRSGLLATLVGIQLAEPVFGFGGTLVLFVASSLVSIVTVHLFVEYVLTHSNAGWLRSRIKPLEAIFGPSLKKGSLFWIAVGNLVGSQWQVSALGVLSGIPRMRVLAGLMLGNVAAFGLVYAFAQVPDLDAVSVMLLVLAVGVLVSSPVLWTHIKAALRLPDKGKN